ncbi:MULTISPECIES: CoA-binding protein [Deinococcus]|uniref:CoA-binding protein n=1 Tax=Deinococcus cavernae TaxID=2320857 RepID=A0A418V770_9DEIO|nr:MULTISPECIES: CoA-binding protein [Deinococcus]RJF71909.1 CoA-binding protein [Deinococcus cavernae]
MTLLTGIPDVIRVLKENKVIAVVGFHRDTMKPAHYVPEYMSRQGYTIIPVNPSLAARGESFFGHKAVSTLAEISTPVDVVEVFRRSDKVYDHLQDILNMQPLPRVVWLQLGIRDDNVARELTARGIDVIQDRCMLADHRALL